MANIKLTDNDVKHLADLAKLQLGDKQQQKIKGQLEETISFIQNLQELDTEKVAPADHVTGTENIVFEDGDTNDRGLTQDEALMNTKDKKNGCFVVKRIM